MQRTTRYDCAVLGAGPAGAAAASALAKTGLSLVWLVRGDTSGASMGEHLAPEASTFLARLGLIGIIETSAHVRVPGVVSYWGGEDPVERDYIFNPHGQGWNIDRRQFDHDLASAAVARGAEKVSIRRVDTLRQQSKGWWLNLVTDARDVCLESRFLVDATGRSAALSRRLSRRPKQYDRLVGYYAELDAHPDSSDVRLTIEPMADGWWYSVILQEGRLVAVFMTDLDLHPRGVAEAERIWRDRFWTSAVTRFRARAGTDVSSFRVVPAFSQSACAGASDGWLSVGDACSTYDPLAGNGITKALQDSVRAATAVTAWLDGDKDLVEAYIEDRKSAFTEYLATRRRYYGDQPRWPMREFWKRRRSLQLSEPENSLES